MTDNQEWWRGAVFYQIYPRSFFDSNGDGIGDLKGIAEKLDYVADLGAEAIWVSPFFKSPMRDYGYDVADYRDVDPMFGNLDDCLNLIEETHKRDLKIIFDLVLSHTSDQHDWFNESRQSRDNDKSDWYVWADPKKDGSPPNNWQAFFGGPSWSYDVRRGQYYMHNFLSTQPDLNLHNPDVQDAALDVFRFWLDHGVDGFRLDVANCYMHDPELRDNPAAKNPAPSDFNVDFPVPFTMQDHTRDFNNPKNYEFIKRIREVLDSYDDRMALAEIAFSDEEDKATQKYTDGPERFHTAYSFKLISNREASPEYIRTALNEFFDYEGDSWPSWAFSNHDVVRVGSRWHPDKEGYNHDHDLSKTLNALLCSLKGTAFMYQGEELGLPEANIAFDDIQDPWGKYLYPLWQGRDGARTPMPWEKRKPYAGFSTHSPWLPVSASHAGKAVDIQQEDPDSTLNFTKAFLKWRRTHPVLRTGDLEFVESGHNNILTFIRRNDTQEIFCAFNLSDTKTTIDMPDGFDSGYGDFVSQNIGTNVVPHNKIEFATYGCALILKNK